MSTTIRLIWAYLRILVGAITKRSWKPSPGKSLPRAQVGCSRILCCPVGAARETCETSRALHHRSRGEFAASCAWETCQRVISMVFCISMVLYPPHGIPLQAHMLVFMLPTHS
jgi:hypothetical protein